MAMSSQVRRIDTPAGNGHTCLRDFHIVVPERSKTKKDRMKNLRGLFYLLLDNVGGGGGGG
jgi:hypothetical protein